MSKIVKSTSGCWVYTGYKDKYGYGQIRQSTPRKMIFVHRYTYYYYKLMPILKTLNKDTLVLHKCDNTSCCNPEHLFEGTHKDNIQDKVNKNRQAKGVINGRAKLTKEQVVEIYLMKGSLKDISNKFKVSAGTVWGIKNDKEWVWLTNSYKNNIK